jgi:hypothetical protein
LVMGSMQSMPSARAMGVATLAILSPKFVIWANRRVTRLTQASQISQSPRQNRSLRSHRGGAQSLAWSLISFFQSFSFLK